MAFCSPRNCKLLSLGDSARKSFQSEHSVRKLFISMIANSPVQCKMQTAESVTHTLLNNNLLVLVCALAMQGRQALHPDQLCHCLPSASAFTTSRQVKNANEGQIYSLLDCESRIRESASAVEWKSLSHKTQTNNTHIPNKESNTLASHIQ